MNPREEVMFVPWFSKAEWRNVYDDLYSEHVESQERGIQRLFLWKARVPRLAAGVECTLHLLYTTLLDKKAAQDRHTDLMQMQLTYGTALTRFINLISHLGQDLPYHQNLQKVVQNFGIPEWLVSVRHETVHGSLPSLELLRSAAHIALNWLKENYWKAEEHRTRDYVIEERAIRIKSLIKVKDVNSDRQTTLESVTSLIEAYISVQGIKDPNRQQLIHLKDPKALQTIAALLENQEKANEVHHLSTKAANKLLLQAIKDITKQNPDSSLLGNALNLWRARVQPQNAQDYEAAIVSHWNSVCPFFRMLQKSRSFVPYIRNLVQDMDKDEDPTYNVAWFTFLIQQLKSALENGGNSENGLLATEFEKHYDWVALARSLLLRSSSPSTFRCGNLFLGLKGNSSAPLTRDRQLNELMSIMATPRTSVDPKMLSAVRNEPISQAYGVESLETRQPVPLKLNRAPVPEVQSATPIVAPVVPPKAGLWTRCDDEEWSTLPLGCAPGADHSVFPDWTHLTWQITTPAN